MKPEKIAVIKGASIGDAVLSFPLLRNIRKNFPDAEIYFVTGEATSGIDILRTCPYINRIVQIKKNTFLGSMKSVLTVIWLRSMKFDMVFDGAPVTAQSKRLCRILKPKRILEPENYSIHRPVIEMDLSMLKAVGEKTDNGHTELFFGIKKQNIEKNHILVYAGRDSDFHRTWNNENWAQLIATIKRRRPTIKFSIIGGTDCRKRAKEIILHSGITIDDLTGKLSLKETAEMLSRCRMLITTNGGPMQLAAALKTPMVAIHGPSPDMWLHSGKNIINLKPTLMKKKTADPNALYEDKRFSPDNIPVSRALAAAERVLKTAK